MGGMKVSQSRMGIFAMLHRRWRYVLGIIFSSLFVVGCDPVRTTLQPIRLKVVDSASGKPVAGAQVLLKYDFETAQPLPNETDQPAEEWHKHKREIWEQQSWIRGITDKDGQTDIAVKYTVIDRSRGSNPPAWRDWVTDKPFLIRVKESQSPEEESSLLMKPGESMKGKSYTVTVIEIQEPRYVETHR